MIFMSTSNFYKLHASNYYFISSDNCDMFEGQDPEHNYNRSYPGTIWEEKREEGPYLIYGYGHLDVISQKIIRSGYYSDAVLDYDIKICAPYIGNMYLSDYDSYEDMAQAAAQDIIDYMTSYEGLNAGMAAIHRQRIAKKIEAYIEELAGRLDNDLKEDADEVLYCKAIFSNGEAVYCLA